MEYDPSADRSIVDLENINYEESNLESASDYEHAKSETVGSSFGRLFASQSQISPARRAPVPPKVSFLTKEDSKAVSNNFHLKDLNKDIKTYDEKVTNIDSWIDSSIYIAELANCNDE